MIKIEAAKRLNATKLPKGRTSKKEKLENEIRSLNSLIKNQEAVLKRASSEGEILRLTKSLKTLKSKLAALEE